MLTPQEIADAALKEFRKLPRYGSREGDRRRQVHVDVTETDEKFQAFSLEEITERVLKPIAAALASVIPEDVAFFPLELPCIDVPDQWATNSDFLRVIRAKYWAPIYADESEFEELTVLRFEILFELA